MPRRSSAARSCAAFFAGVAIVAPSLAAASGTPALQSYTTPDKTASALVPAGWHVTRGADSVIVMSGPHAESISLGITAIALNAGPGVAPPTSTAGIAFNLPYSTPLKQKFLTIWQHAAAAQGKPVPQFTFASGTLLKVAPILGQCARSYGTVTGVPGAPASFETTMCSLPPDFGGAYKNILNYAQVPTGLATQERALAEAVLASYRIPRAELAKKLGPVYATPRMVPGANAAAAATMGSVWAQANAASNASNCFDLSILRETPDDRLPVSCGGSAPNY